MRAPKWLGGRRVRGQHRITTTPSPTQTTTWTTSPISTIPKDMLTIFPRKVSAQGLLNGHMAAVTLTMPAATNGVLFSDLIGDLMGKRPKETDGVESIVVVDGVPQVGADRLAKLQNVLGKLFKNYGTITNSYYALNDDGSTKG